ncbi:MAG: EAL domain-containing protein [Polyangiaceae bacterium]|nr:EAL domain-containing protein [Polyangiaceae bacterium]
MTLNPAHRSLQKQVPADKPAASVEESDQPYTVERVGIALHSVFQPIASISHAKVIGHEALLRGKDSDGQTLSPGQIFPQLVAAATAQEVNATCTKLHLASFAHQDRDGWLFLNVSPDAMTSREEVVELFGAWLCESGVPAHQVVVEIIETRSFDEEQLALAVEGFRDLGCLVAIDDFGAGESNFERVWRLRPDLVKLDRAMLTEATNNPLIRRLLPGIVSLVHEAGCLVVMEGIETREQALIAAEADVDFVQGFYFSRPSLEPADEKKLKEQLLEVHEDLRFALNEKSESEQSFYHSFSAALEDCARAISGGIEFVQACSNFLAVPGVQRIYRLDAGGQQLGANLEADLERADDPRFAPCADGAGANWYRRPYFQRAIRAPGHVQVSRPYLSIRDARNCVTMSLAFTVSNHTVVICADLDSQDVMRSSGNDARESGVMRR